MCVQRSPAHQANPSWSTKGPGNAPGSCEPMNRIEAELAWRYARWKAPAGLTARCGCPRVGDAYGTFLDAGGGSVVATDPKDRINVQLGQEEDAHTAVEDEARAALTGKVDDLARAMGAQNETRLPLVATLFGGGPRRLMAMTCKRNKLAGGQLFGGGGTEEKAKDSEYGADTRHQSGEIVLRVTDRSDPVSITVVPEIHLRYDVVGALDFCPGNTALKSKKEDPSGHYNQLTKRSVR